MLPAFRPYEVFCSMHNTKIEGLHGTLAYNGQVDQLKKAHGMGVVVSTNGKIYEGYFVNGVIMQPYMDIHFNGDVYAHLKTADGR